MTPAQLTKLAIAALEDLKGSNIELIDVTPLTTIADHMVICTGTSNRHVKALADSVLEKAREAGVREINAEGLEQGEWALVDLNGTLIHIMQASARATYQLEKLWDLGQPKPRLDEPKAKPAAKKKAAKAKKAAKPAVKKSQAKKPLAKKMVGKKPTPVAKSKKASAKKPAKPLAKSVTKAANKKVTAKKPLAKKPAIKKPAAKKPLAKGKKR